MNIIVIANYWNDGAWEKAEKYLDLPVVPRVGEVITTYFGSDYKFCKIKITDVEYAQAPHVYAFDIIVSGYVIPYIRDFNFKAPLELPVNIPKCIYPRCTRKSIGGRLGLTMCSKHQPYPCPQS